MEAGADEVLALLGHSVSEAQLGVADVLVPLEGDVAADHVKEEDAQGPDSSRLPLVASLANPLRWRVDSGA